jgi:hypothetical protein
MCTQNEKAIMINTGNINFPPIESGVNVTASDSEKPNVAYDYAGI